jgi:drug/metabolite transporter (DMT)-like permease
LITTALAVLFLKEPINISFVFGLILILGGAYLVAMR